MSEGMRNGGERDKVNRLRIETKLIYPSPYWSVCAYPCILMDSSFWFNTINLGVHCTYLGVSGYDFQKILY